MFVLRMQKRVGGSKKEAMKKIVSIDNYYSSSAKLIDLACPLHVCSLSNR